MSCGPPRKFIFFIGLFLIAQLSGQSSCSLKFLPRKKQSIDSSSSIRIDGDGSVDSICLKCLLTIADERPEVELGKHDVNHVCKPSILSRTSLQPRPRRGRLALMKYIAEYVVSHLGSKHSRTLVLASEGTPKVGDILDVRLGGRPMPIKIDSVNFRKETYGIQHASLVCSTYTL
jgi:hypothetical protein